MKPNKFELTTYSLPCLKNTKEWNGEHTSKKFQWLLFLLVILGLSCKTEHKEHQGEESKSHKFVLKNTSNTALTDKAVIIGKNEIFKSDIPKDGFLLVRNELGDTISSQMDDIDGDGNWDEVFFLMDFEPKAEVHIEVDWAQEKTSYTQRSKVRFGVRSSAQSKVVPAIRDTFYARELPGVMGYQPYQTDGPSWENDKVGFRHYLDGRNSKDVFGKKVSYMSPDSVGINGEGVTEDNYHVMEEWGRDILSVGKSVGIGGFGLKIGETYARIGVTQADSINNVDKTYFEILASGPIRSLMKYEYLDWNIESSDRSYDVHERTSIWPGMYAFKNEIAFKGLKGDETVFLGLVNSNTDKALSRIDVKDFLVFYTHDKQTYEKEWYLGLAIIVPKSEFITSKEVDGSKSFSESFVAEMKIKKGTSLSYYAVAAWELADANFKKEAYFKSYLSNLAEQLSAKVICSKVE